MSAASFASGPIAPGEIVTLFGSNLGPTALIGLRQDASTGRVSSAIDGVRVLFDNVAAPLIYTSDTQIGTIVPYEVDGKSSTAVQIEINGARSKPYSAEVASSAPAAFALNASGSGQGAILNEDNSVNGASNPAGRGSVIVIYATGEGQTNPPGVNGALASTVYPKPTQRVAATVGGVSAELVYAGAAPTLVAGVLQINLRLPTSASTGAAVPVIITVGEKSSSAGITVSVK